MSKVTKKRFIACKERGEKILNILNSKKGTADVTEFINTIKFVDGVLEDYVKSKDKERPKIPDEGIKIEQYLKSYEDLLIQLSNSGRFLRFFTSNRVRKSLDQINSQLHKEVSGIFFFLQENKRKANVGKKGKPKVLKAELEQERQTECIKDIEGKLLWESSFGQTLMVEWQQFTNSLQKLIPLNADQDKQLRYILDNSNTGYVSMYKFSDFLSGFGPLKLCIEKVQGVLNADWFHGFLSSVEAERLLERQSPGTFLIRFSKSKPGSFAIAYVDSNNKDAVTHTLIACNQEGGFKIEEAYNRNARGRLFVTLAEVVDFYSYLLKNPFRSDLAKQGWFHGDLNNQEAEEIIANVVEENKKQGVASSEGIFLFRFSSKPGFLAVSYLSRNEVKHGLLETVPGGYKFDGQPPIYPTLQDVVTNLNDILKTPITNLTFDVSKSPLDWSKKGGSIGPRGSQPLQQDSNYSSIAEAFQTKQNSPVLQQPASSSRDVFRGPELNPSNGYGHSKGPTPSTNMPEIQRPGLEYSRMNMEQKTPIVRTPTPVPSDYISMPGSANPDPSEYGTMPVTLQETAANDTYGSMPKTDLNVGDSSEYGAMPPSSGNVVSSNGSEYGSMPSSSGASGKGQEGEYGIMPPTSGASGKGQEGEYGIMPPTSENPSWNSEYGSMPSTPSDSPQYGDMPKVFPHPKGTVAPTRTVSQQPNLIPTNGQYFKMPTVTPGAQSLPTRMSIPTNPRASTVQNQYGQMPNPGSNPMGSNVMSNRTPQYGQMPNPGPNPRASVVVNNQTSQYVTAGQSISLGPRASGVVNGPRASGVVNGPRASGVVNGPISQYGQMPNPGSHSPPQYGRISSGTQSQGGGEVPIQGSISPFGRPPTPNNRQSMAPNSQYGKMPNPANLGSSLPLGQRQTVNLTGQQNSLNYVKMPLPGTSVNRNSLPEKSNPSSNQYGQMPNISFGAAKTGNISADDHEYGGLPLQRSKDNDYSGLPSTKSKNGIDYGGLPSTKSKKNGDGEIDYGGLPPKIKMNGDGEIDYGGLPTKIKSNGDDEIDYGGLPSPNRISSVHKDDYGGLPPGK